MQYGKHALEVGTMVKLVRALWIVPVTLVMARIYRAKMAGSTATPIKYPWFILGFLLMSAIVTWLPRLQGIGHNVEWLGKRLLIVTLFFIGAGLTRSTLQRVGFRPLLHGCLLWLIVAVANLIFVINF
jgi:uncharacterized membrane protein YadS